ncbi:hypothetical protein MARPU_06855 [Marichromatium purpuratum 984]|uniref:Uncharacterized protein n=1 Tax=Marichromatium purpuratum 984 TaxID=765910 RepID=W0E3W4_MARPU|nr:hypothetical protein MARPU_06855 [Marichromatium purpuratum 984]
MQRLFQTLDALLLRLPAHLLLGQRGVQRRQRIGRCHLVRDRGAGRHRQAAVDDIDQGQPGDEHQRQKGNDEPGLGGARRGLFRHGR